jgi:AcrR family transcriptional regulator
MASAVSRVPRKLKPGPGLPRDVVLADQRKRLRVAVIELAATQGFERVTVRGLSREAGVSTRTFYLHFANVADCFAFACESSMLAVLTKMRAAGAGALGPEAAFRSAVDSLLAEVAARPDTAKAFLVEVYAAGFGVRARLDATVGTFEGALAELLAPIAPDVTSSRLLGGLVAGMTRILRMTTMAGRAEELAGMATAVSDWMLSVARAPRPVAAPRARPQPRREPEPFPAEPSLGSARSMGDERERIVRATIRLGVKGGFKSLTATEIRRVAGVSRRCFDAQFADLDECFLGSIEWLVSLAADRGTSWAAQDQDPRRRKPRLVVALTAQAARNELLARFALVGILEAGRAGLLRREHLIATAAERLRDCQADARPDWEADAAVATAWHIAALEVSTGKAKNLPRLAPLLASLVAKAPPALVPARR